MAFSKFGSKPARYPVVSFLMRRLLVPPLCSTKARSLLAVLEEELLDVARELLVVHYPRAPSSIFDKLDRFRLGAFPKLVT